jgi:predicted dehydrogenase
MGIGVGIVGCGMFGRAFVRLFRDHPDVSRVALADTRPEKVAAFSREFGVAETYSSLDEMLTTDLDAVALFTQHWRHGPQAIQVLDAGKNVYSAVPTAQSLDECDRLVEAVERTGLVYMLGETSYYYPHAIFCRAKAREGAFGRFVHGEAEYIHDMSHDLERIVEARWQDEWGPDKMGDPPFYYPTHSTSIIITVMGAHMTEVSAQGYVHPSDDWFRKDTIWANEFSNETALFRMSNGATARVSEMRRLGHKGAVRACLIYGTEGSFETNLAGSVWTTKTGYETVKPAADTSALPPELARDPGGHEGSHAFLVHEFVDSIVRDRLPANNVWQAVRYFAPGYVAHESALKGGELMKVPDWGDAPAD